MENQLTDPRSSSSAASCSASTSYSNFDAFLNHRGPDIKNTFASHLYRRLVHQGVRAFLDREVLEEGRGFPSQIKDAIDGASVHVAIFSPTYADSPWCLDELVQMFNSGAPIIPIFYHVNPSMVRWTSTGPYGEALRRLEEKKTLDIETGVEKPRYDPSTIQEWRNALSDAADLSGFVHGDDDDEGELLDVVVQRVCGKIPKEPLDEAEYPTGLDLKFREFEMSVLKPHENTKRLEAKVVGIWGVGGVGKTTLAKAFFNRRSSSYKASSFLFDVREYASKGSLSHLQSKLIKELTQTDIQIENIAEGKGLLKRHLSHHHALIIIDDVDNRDQLAVLLPIKDILSPRSLIVVTSRDKHVLRSLGVLESSIYNLQGLNTLHSKQLFCSYAFCSPFPPPEFADLVDQYVKACDGLPLSLKVFGALVGGEDDKGYWEELLDRLRQTPPEEILSILRISYDSLHGDDQSAFLDIASSFIGEDLRTAIKIWGTVALRNLENKCLLQVDRENKLHELTPRALWHYRTNPTNIIKMHYHLRDLGIKIAHKEWMPRRLWHYTTNTIDEQSSVITEVRGIKTVNSPDWCKAMTTVNSSDWYEAMATMNSEMPWYRRFSDVVFGNYLRHLFNNFGRGAVRNLNLQYVATEDGYLEHILSRVRSPNLKLLRWYKCPYSFLPSWIPMENLKVLEVAGGRLKLLWKPQTQAPLLLLELHVIAPISGFPKSIGQLNLLEKIVLHHPEQHSIPLETLPEEFSDLRSLKYLELSGCYRLKLLPHSFGKLTSLQHIDLYGASSLRVLPDSFGHLSRLKHLSLSGCSNLTIPNRTLGNITTLEFLDVSSCNQGLLEELYLKGMDLEELPGGMLGLCNLELCFGGDLLEDLPPWLGYLKSLNHLFVFDSPKLTALPDSFGRLTRLRKLALYRCGIEYLPPDFAMMKYLETLRVESCPLRELPFKKVEEETGSSTDHKCLFGLKELELYDTAMSEVSFPMGVCPNIRELTFNKCLKLTQIELCGLGKVHSLEIIGCPLKELPSFETLISLKKLSVIGCEEMESIQGLEHVMSFKILLVKDCKEMKSIQGLERVMLLKRLHVLGCPKVEWDRGELEQLQQQLRGGFIVRDREPVFCGDEDEDGFYGEDEDGDRLYGNENEDGFIVRDREPGFSENENDGQEDEDGYIVRDIEPGFSEDENNGEDEDENGLIKMEMKMKMKMKMKMDS